MKVLNALFCFTALTLYAADYEPHFLLSAIAPQSDPKRCATLLEKKLLSKAQNTCYIRSLQDLTIEVLVKQALISSDNAAGIADDTFLTNNIISQHLPLVARAYALYMKLPIHSTDSAQWWPAPAILIDAYNRYLASEGAGFSINELLKYQILNSAHLFNTGYESHYSGWHRVHEPQKPNTLLLQSNCLHSLDGLSVPEEKHLELLSLGDNKFTAAALACLTRFTSLIALSLDSNRLAQLPTSLVALTNLQYLYLDNNQLDTLNSTILTQLKQLKVLSLGHNNLTELPQEIARLTHLQKLSAPCNRLHTVPDSLTRLQNLQDIDFAYNQLTFLPDGIARIYQHWLTLDVRKNPFSAKEACRIREEFNKRLIGKLHI